MKKQLKKSLSLLLTLVMVLSLLPTAALAATAITPTTPAGSGTSADPYRIGTAEELYGFQLGIINVIRDAEVAFFPIVNIGF